MPDFTQYQPPGVYFTEEETPLVAALGPLPTAVVLVGPSVGYRTFTELVTLSGTTDVRLTKLGIDQGSIVVMSLDGLTTYVDTVDYNLTEGAGEDASLLTTQDNTTDIARDGGGAIADPETVRVSYQYTDAAYFQPLTVSDFDRVKEAYGQPFDTQTGEILSPLSMAAKFAFDNGAARLVLVASEGTPSAVTRTQLTDAYEQIESLYDVAIVVPLPVGITGTDMAPGDVINVGTDLKTHVEGLSGDGYFRVGIVGYEKTVTVDPEDISGGINSSRVMFAYPNKMNYYNGFSNTVIEVSGYYLAAAYAGRFASLPSQQALTKKDIRGFSGIPADVFATMTQANKNLWSSSGVSVVEINRQNRLVNRHGVATDPSNVLTREFSLTRAKDEMVRLLTDMLDNSGLIGSPITANTPVQVRSVVQGGLESLVKAGTINGYREIKVRQQLGEEGGDPTVMEVKFLYSPAYPLNYVLVTFAIDTTTGATTFA
jgi:hypothetical protein